jgi:putative hydrolase of the HAD superfamily
MPELRAITFDLWDTIVHDDSDEPKRKAAGLRSKKQERRHVLWKAINQDLPIDEESVQLAYNVTDAAFNHVWRTQHVTWPIADRIDIMLKGLGRSLTDDARAKVIDAHERMEVDIPPDLIEGCRETLEALSQRYALAIVSDAIVTPGSQLRELLEQHGVKQFFRGFAFSDEVGHSKPHRSMFASAAEQLGVPLESMLHVGDRDHNDVCGAHAAGLKAILFTATRNIDRECTTADAICESYAALPGTIEQLAMN